MQIQTSNLVSSVLLQLKDNFKSEMIKFIKIRQKASNPPILKLKKILKNKFMERQAKKHHPYLADNLVHLQRWENKSKIIKYIKNRTESKELNQGILCCLDHMQNYPQMKPEDNTVAKHQRDNNKQ